MIFYLLFDSLHIFEFPAIEESIGFPDWLNFKDLMIQYTEITHSNTVVPSLVFNVAFNSIPQWELYFCLEKPSFRG